MGHRVSLCFSFSLSHTPHTFTQMQQINDDAYNSSETCLSLSHTHTDPAVERWCIRCFRRETRGICKIYGVSPLSRSLSLSLTHFPAHTLSGKWVSLWQRMRPLSLSLSLSPLPFPFSLSFSHTLRKMGQHSQENGSVSGQE